MFDSLLRPASIPERPLAGRVLAGACVVLCLLGWAVLAQHTPSYLLPAPQAVWQSLEAFGSNRELVFQLLLSVLHAVAGSLIACALGIGLAFLAYYVPATALAIHGRFSPFINAFSAVGWVFLCEIWLGLGNTSVIVIITAVCLPFAIVNTQLALATIDRELLEMGRSFGGAWRNLVHLILPALRSSFMASLQSSFGMAWKVGLTAEMFAGNTGLGYVVNIARQSYDTARIIVVIGLITAIVLLLERVKFAYLLRRFRYFRHLSNR